MICNKGLVQSSTKARYFTVTIDLGYLVLGSFCLSLLIQKSCGISSWSLGVKLVIILVSYPGTLVR